MIDDLCSGVQCPFALREFGNCKKNILDVSRLSM